MIKVAIADDQLLFRKGIEALINGFKNMKLVLEADSGRSLLEALEKEEPLPDVILLDLKMPDMNGMEASKLIHEKYPAIKIIILSVYDDQKFIIHLLELGVHGYLFKNSEPAEVCSAIETVMKTGFYLNEPVLLAMREGIQKKSKVSIDSYGLSTRELEVLALICKEFTAQEIADKLFISIRTVEGHRNNLLLKTGARNTAGLVIFAIRHHLVELDL